MTLEFSDRLDTHKNSIYIFLGDCTPTGYPTVSFTAIENLSLMTPFGVHAWMWAFLSLSLVWLFSSFTLLTSKFSINQSQQIMND